MKKIVSCLVVLLLLIAVPTQVRAMENAVTITSASLSTTTMAVSGTTAATAVMIQIRDSVGEIVGMGSLPVAEGSFSGSISGFYLSQGETYTLYVADYEGGDWTTLSVQVPGDTAAPGETSVVSVPVTTKSPDTGEDPMTGLFAIVSLSIGLSACGMVLGMRRRSL